VHGGRGQVGIHADGIADEESCSWGEGFFFLYLMEAGKVVNRAFDIGWNGASGPLELAVGPEAKAVEKAANNTHDGSCGHWLFVDFGQEIELWESNFTFFLVESMGAL